MLIIDLLAIDWALYRPIGVAEAFADGSEPAAWLANSRDQFRAYSPSYSIPQHVGQLFQLQLADGIDPLQLRRYVMFMYQASGVGAWPYAVTLPAFLGAQTDEDIRTALKDIQPNAALLGLLNVKYIAAAFPIAQPDLIERARVQLDVMCMRIARVLPRAFLVIKIDVAASPEAASAWLDDARCLDFGGGRRAAVADRVARAARQSEIVSISRRITSRLERSVRAGWC